VSQKILLLPGDGIGPEIIAEARRLLEWVDERYSLGLEMSSGLIGGSAIDEHGEPYPEVTHQQAEWADAILLGAVGGPKWDSLEAAMRPEKGLLSIRSRLDLFCNLRPAILYPQLADASSLKPEVVAGLDILIIRELTGGIYFGQPRGIESSEAGAREGFNTYRYNEQEIRRIGHLAFQAARKRQGRLCSVDKANVLEVTVLWRDVMEEIAPEYPDVSLSHMYVDNAAMQLVREPKQFDVLVTGNMFGDILSDEAAMLTGSIGMLPSASLNSDNKGLYEPCHGSAPDIAGQGLANPLATLLSVAMMFRHSLDNAVVADHIEKAVGCVLDRGLRTADIMSAGMSQVSTVEMGGAMLSAMKETA
jgi:3-isopropylmalate dehydrogenase